MRTLQVGNSGAVYSGSEENLRAQFDREHYLKFPRLLGPGVFDFLQPKVNEGDFYERVHDGIASNKELCMTGNAAFGALLCLINDEKLFQVIQDVTQCDQIRCFEGRVYRV